MSETHAIVADLFRREAGRLTALLASRVGAARIDLVEDAVQDALIAAMRSWPIHGTPANPPAWLYTAARNAMTDRLRRARFEKTRVDPIDIPSVVDPKAASNFLNWGVCSGLENAKGLDIGCSVAFKYGMKRDFNVWLASLGDRAPVKSLTELRQWNITHQRAGSIKYGQQNLDVSDEMDVAADRVRYESDRRKDLLLSGTNGLDAAIVMLVVILVVQNIVQTIVLVKLAGNALSLHPIVVLGATIIGAAVAGMLGAALSSPAVAVAILVRRRLAEAGTPVPHT